MGGGGGGGGRGEGEGQPSNDAKGTITVTSSTVVLVSLISSKFHDFARLNRGQVIVLI